MKSPTTNVRRGRTKKRVLLLLGLICLAGWRMIPLGLRIIVKDGKPLDPLPASELPVVAQPAAKRAYSGNKEEPNEPTGRQRMSPHLGADSMPDVPRNTTPSRNYTQVERMLESLSIKFYMYSDPVITQEAYFRQRKSWNDGQRQEIAMIQAFANHALRTYNSTEASVFVIPLPMIAVRKRPLKAAMDALMKHPVFLQHPGGDKHLIFATHGRFLEANYRGSDTARQLSESYGRFLRNITMVKKFDIFSSKRLGVAASPDWQRLFAAYRPKYAHVVSVGLLVADSLPVIRPSMDKFDTASIRYFYRTRREKMARGSTKFRLALLNERSDTNTSTNNSIGYDLPMEQWLHDFTHAKYCVSIRGDDPATKSLNRAIKVGCLPIVISDYLPQYAPTFPRILHYPDYTIFVPEADFLANPYKALQDATNQTTRAKVEEKLNILQFAQRVTFPDHPESLFVPALLYEAVQARKRPIE